MNMVNILSVDFISPLHQNPRKISPFNLYAYLFTFTEVKWIIIIAFKSYYVKTPIVGSYFRGRINTV